MTNKKESSFDELFTTKLDIAPLFMGYNSKEEEIIFYVKETGNKKHESSQRKYSKLLEKSRRNQTRYRAVMAKIVAESILDSWKGVLDKDGNEIESTLENKIDALIKYKRLFFDVLDFASDVANFQDQDDDDDESMEPDDSESNGLDDPEGIDDTPEEATEKNSEVS